MRRTAIVGNCGAGKTILAPERAANFDLTHIAFDALFHQADRTATPPHEFQAILRAAMANADATTDGFTTCANYREAMERPSQHAANTIVWLDISRSFIMRRVVARTLRRAVTCAVL
jgi:adenylate kinase family enzyme